MVNVKTKYGEFEIRKPTAGERNKAAEKAEIPNVGIKASVFFPELLPYCITRHPYGISDVEKLKEQIENFKEVTEYDKLIDALKSQMDVGSDVEKKSEQPLESGTETKKEDIK